MATLSFSCFEISLTLTYDGFPVIDGLQQLVKFTLKELIIDNKNDSIIEKSHRSQVFTYLGYFIENEDTGFKANDLASNYQADFLPDYFQSFDDKNKVSIIESNKGQQREFVRAFTYEVSNDVISMQSYLFTDTYLFARDGVEIQKCLDSGECNKYLSSRREYIILNRTEIGMTVIRVRHVKYFNDSRREWKRLDSVLHLQAL